MKNNKMVVQPNFATQVSAELKMLASCRSVMTDYQLAFLHYLEICEANSSNSYEELSKELVNNLSAFEALQLIWLQNRREGK